MPKIAIYGGTFDPCHEGHIEIIKRLSKDFDEVIVVPTTIRYYKVNTQMFSFNERYEQMKLRCKAFSNVTVSDIERDVDNSWRFIDTLRRLASGKIMNSLNEYQYYVVMGSDSFQKFKTWCDYEEILKRAKLLVFRRPGFEDNFPEDIEYEYIKDIDIKISSTEIREELREKLFGSFDDMMDDASFLKGFEDQFKDLEYCY